MANTTNTTKWIRLPSYEARILAVAAEADPRSVQRVVRGAPTKDVVRVRIERALEALGYSITIGASGERVVVRARG